MSSIRSTSPCLNRTIQLSVHNERGYLSNRRAALISLCMSTLSKFISIVLGKVVVSIRKICDRVVSKFGDISIIL